MMSSQAEETQGGGLVGDPVPIQLTAGASAAIANDGYCYGERRIDAAGQHGRNRYSLDAGERITMQVVGMARLKYDTNFPQDSRVSFQCSQSICYSEDHRIWDAARPYRLLLSDGLHTVAGKFSPEATHLAFHPKGKIHGEIHDLVKCGQLKEGSIISFVPNCHIDSGKGIVTIFRMEIEGWKEVIMKPPCHDGALAFSPADIHHCTLSTLPDGKVLDKEGPINSAVVLLAKTIKDKCGHCTISGSAALAQYLHTLPGCDHCYEKHYSAFTRNLCRSDSFNNDIDIFVPECPQNLTNYYEAGHVDRLQGDDFDESTLMDKIFPALYKKYGIRHTEVVRTNILLSRLGQEDSLDPYELLDNEDGVTETTVDYGWMRIFVGLKRKLEFNLISPTGEITPKPIQILVVDAFPKSQEQSWGNLIMEGFDADVIKCAIDIDAESDGLAPVAFYDHSSLYNVHCGKFEYTMRPCHSFPQMLKRLKKYRARGFTLTKFSFDSRVSQEWQDHILHEFRLEFAEGWWKEILEQAGFSGDGNDLPLIATNHVLPYLGRFSGDNLSDRVVFQTSNEGENVPPVVVDNKDQQAIARGMLRRNILDELVRTNYRDPGNAELNRTMLVNIWKRVDSEDEEVNMESFWKDATEKYPWMNHVLNDVGLDEDVVMEMGN